MMKKILLILTMLFGISFGANAFTRKEYIQENLSKLGIKQDIIDETIKLDKEIGDTTLNESSEGGTTEKKRTQQLKKAKELFKKDKNNYIILEKILGIAKSKERNEEIKEYENLYLKAKIPEDAKNFFLGEYFFLSGQRDKMNEYFKKVKDISKNVFYLKMTEFYKMLEMKEEAENNNKDTEKENKRIKEFISTGIIKTGELNKILNNSSLMKESGISDEEVYSRQLDVEILRVFFYVFNDELEKGIDDYIQNIANKKVSKDVLEYNKEKDVFTMMMTIMTPVFKIMFGALTDTKNKDEINEKSIEKIMEKFIKTEKYRQFEKEGLMDEINLK